MILIVVLFWDNFVTGQVWRGTIDTTKFAHFARFAFCREDLQRTLMSRVWLEDSSRGDSMYVVKWTGCT